MAGGAKVDVLRAGCRGMGKKRGEEERREEERREEGEVASSGGVVPMKSLWRVNGER